MKERLRLILRILLLSLVGAAVLSGCATSLQAIKTSPNRFAGAQVTVAGRVGKTVKVPFISVYLFSLSDEGTSMLVISTAAPKSDSQVRMRVRVVGVAGKKALSESQSAVQSVERFLISNDLADKRQANAISRTVLSVVGTVLGGVQGSYFLIEENGR